MIESLATPLALGQRQEEEKDFSFSQEPWNLLFRIFVAAVFGGILAMERDIHRRGAGLRTHLLVSSGAALFLILSTHISTAGVATSVGFSMVTDPGRIAAQIVTGIGFIGAGVIIREGFTIRGLTTAACLWMAAAIGMASGAGFYLIALVTTLLALFSIILLRRLERHYRRDVYRDLEVTVSNEVDIPWNDPAVTPSGATGSAATGGGSAREPPARLPDRRLSRSC